VVLGVDLGKTACRVRLETYGDVTERRGDGFPGLHALSGPDAAVAAIASVLDGFDSTRLQELSVIGIGAAGADAAPDAAYATASMVRERWAADVVIGSDVLTAHLGALDGAAGTILIAGTGAVAYRIGDDETRSRVDGWGPWLGDEGSGRWIGQAGLSAVVRATDGRGAATALAEDARSEFGGPGDLARAIGADAESPRRLAAFAPSVLNAAGNGDAVARRIVDEAIRHLVDSAAAVATEGEEVALLGGLVEHSGFRSDLAASLAARGLTPRSPAGSALDGATALADHRAPLHERYAIRV
jgi:N-acetylglucosamine kinase-like BadF-type ATPase